MSSSKKGEFLNINTDKSDNFFSEGLINYLLSTSSSNLPWLQNIKNIQSITTSFHELDAIDQRLYAKLFARKDSWIRFKRIAYFFVNDLPASIQRLESKRFVTTDYSKESIPTILEKLEKDEVKALCKEHKLDIKGNKSDMIIRLVKKSKTQKTIMFGSGLSSEAVLMKSIKKFLKCVKLSPEAREIFQILVLLNTYPHYRGEESKRITDFAKSLYEKNKGIIVYHKYNLRPVDVFLNIARLHEYMKSLEIVEGLISAKEKKDWKNANIIINLCKIDFKVFMSNEMNIKFLDDWKSNDFDYLLKFTSGRNYAYVLSSGVEVLKKNESTWEEAIEVLLLLLKQKYFLRGARGNWYKELALVYEKQHNHERMVDTLVEGLQDPRVLSNYSIVGLITKSESMAKRKAVSESSKKRLLKAIPVSNYTPESIMITATSAPNVTTSKKQIFVKNTEKGKEYSSVEEVARKHYMSEFKYTSGIHDEGKLLITCILACFWEVIFYDVEGVFHSELQSAPLDWGLSGFYRRRESVIEELLKDISEETAPVFLEKITKKYCGIVGPVDWGVFESRSMQEAQQFLTCLTTDVFTKIANYLMKDYKSRRSGLPDLTLWDTNSHKCILVEVKGPSDTLSPNQIKWLEKLNEFGATAEVCRVNTLNSGPKNQSKKRKLDEDV